MRVVRAATTAALLLTLGLAPLAAQQPPSTDIFLADLDLTTSPPRLDNVRNLTDRDGYDNQPSFEPEGRGLLYTSSRDGQTDIYRITLATGVSDQLTETLESEYSPTVMPGGLELSVVRVEEDGTQRLWAFRRDGSAPRLLLESIAPVGYHAWGQAGAVVLFVLGEPPTLQLANVESGEAEVLASDIGRSLARLPDDTGFSFAQRTDDTLTLRLLRDDGNEITSLGEALTDSQDLAWVPDGRMLMAQGSQLYIRRSGGNWQPVVDLADQNVRGITRIAVSPDGSALALVAERPAAQ